MKALKFFLIGVSSLGLLFLGACSSSNETASNAPSPVTPDAAAKSSESRSKALGESEDHPKISKGGQVVESGHYHLEFVPIIDSSETYLNFYLQKGDTHAVIPNAKVTAQVQIPNGTQKSLNLKYYSEGKYYAAVLPGSAAGEYKVAILSDINGAKVNGRFTFKQ